jgi:SAM-dependent methyltransferase
MSELFSYDQLPYPSYTFPNTFPDRLATMAALYGIETADPSSCRLLELGCGDGTNLLAMAYASPGAKFTGLDLSQFHIDKARRSAEWIDAKNVDFHQADIAEIDPKDLGGFDYIVAHGLFSWVPESVRSAILNIYSQCLAPNGVGYISYNVFPGAHIRKMVWDMMQFCADGEMNPSVKVQKAREIVTFVADSAGADTAYKALLQEEVTALATREDQGVFHDDLGTFNRPFYLHEFIEKLEHYGLRYFADADPEPPIERNLSQAALGTLDALSNGNRIKREQFIDFVRAQRFRRSLFCRTDLTVFEDIPVDAIDRLMITSGLEQVNVASDGSSKFVGPDDQSIELNHPLTIAVLTYVKKEWPRAVPFATVLQELADPNVTEEDVAIARTQIMELFRVKLVDLHRFQAAFVREVSAKPEASRFARLQMDLGGSVVTTMAGSNIEMNIQPLRILISLLDGTRDRGDLINALAERVEVPVAEVEALRRELPQFIESNLQKMCELGLLIG